MNIQEIHEKLNTRILDDRVFLSAVVVLTGIAAYALGYYAGTESNQNSNAASSGIHIQDAAEDSADEVASVSRLPGRFVGSMHSDRYHLPWCSGAARIESEHKIWFDTKDEAEAAGYIPAANCAGLSEHKEE